MFDVPQSTDWRDTLLPEDVQMYAAASNKTVGSSRQDVYAAEVERGARKAAAAVAAGSADCTGPGAAGAAASEAMLVRGRCAGKRRVRRTFIAYLDLYYSIYIFDMQYFYTIYLYFNFCNVHYILYIYT